MTLTIAQFALGGGTLALSPLPGRSGRYQADLLALYAWAPDLVISLTTLAEEEAKDATSLAQDLADHEICHLRLPIPDFSMPDAAAQTQWPKIAAEVKQCLSQHGRVLIHCMAGCGRSGTIALRLMVECGEPAEAALTRLRQSRPCAVETQAQYLWASS